MLERVHWVAIIIGGALERAILAARVISRVLREEAPVLIAVPFGLSTTLIVGYYLHLLSSLVLVNVPQIYLPSWVFTLFVFWFSVLAGLVTGGFVFTFLRTLWRG